jgi:NAD(P)-dependent dehydrogenase (short-subunit alcohol dehydrogenase family)
MNPSKAERIVVMTGATNGLGVYAVKRIAAQADTQMIIGARGSGRTAPAGTQIIPLDLASLASVRTFADEVKRRLNGGPINMLVLNAGARFRSGSQQSADGFEATFAVNHLAHYLLARLLLSSMADGARLVITTSDTHDPAIIPIGPRTLDPQRLAHPPAARFGSSIFAYPASKLCNLLTARSFAALDEVKARHIQVIAYNPGLTLGTRLGSPDSQRQSEARMPGPLPRAIIGLLSRVNSAFYPGTPERAGEVLADLTLGTVTPPPGRLYVSLVKGEITFPDPSVLARSNAARDMLWRESAIMVGLQN